MSKNPSALLTLKDSYMRGLLTWDEYIRLRRKALKHGVYAEKKMSNDFVHQEAFDAWLNEKIVRFVFGENVESSKEEQE